MNNFKEKLNPKQKKQKSGRKFCRKGDKKSKAVPFVDFPARLDHTHSIPVLGT